MDGLKPRKIERISVVDQIAELLKQSILSGKFLPGNKLPSEAEIAQMYGVNRLSVRMALQKLATLGVIETRVGEGSFVKDFSIIPVFEEISDYYDAENNLAEIQEMRHLLEAASVTAAVRDADDCEIFKLKDCLNQYLSALNSARESSTPSNQHALVEKDFAFHAQIVHMAHNRLFEDVYYMVQNLTMGHIEKLLQLRNVTNSDTPPDEYHTHLYECIANRDTISAQKVLDQIICGFESLDS